MNNDDSTTAILVQLPLPQHINEHKIIETIDFRKDVDGFCGYNIAAIAQGREPFVYPCTPKGIISLLKKYDVPLLGKHAVVVGRSNIVGRPMASMLLKENATVTVCHSRTENLAEITQNADILVSAVGIPHLIKSHMVKTGACVLDVGINRLENGKLVGDVAYESVFPIAGWITPVPGGVGPMTIASLMENTIELFYKNRGE